MISSDGRPEIKRDFSSSIEFYSIEALRQEYGARSGGTLLARKPRVISRLQHVPHETQLSASFNRLTGYRAARTCRHS
jgi:hypothetical protein